MATTKKTTKPKAKVSSKAKPKSSSIGSTIKTATKAALIPGYGALTAAKKLDDYIQKKDPNLSKSKTYGAAKQPAKKVKGAMDYVSDKAISFAKGAADVIGNPGKYIEKGAAKVGKLAAKGAKAIDDKIEKADPNLSKSKVYGAIKGAAKDVVKSKAIEKVIGVAAKKAALVSPMGASIAGRELGKGAVAAGKYAKAKIKEGAKAADDYVQKNDPNLSKSKTYGAVKSVAKSALGVKSGSAPKKATPAKSSTAKPAAKTTTKAAPAKTTTASTKTNAAKSAPSVSELWKQKTGTSWSEAKKLGLSDGSASSNIALMKKLQSGSVNKNTVKAAKPGSAASMKSFEKEMNKNVQDELSGKTSYPAPANSSKQGADKAADENKMRRGGMVRRRMQSGGDTTSIGGYIVKGNPGMDYKSKYKKAISKKPSVSVPAAGATKQMKTGGMVNSNSKVSAIKSAGSRGVKTGSNTRISASKVARGRVGGTSTAPRTAAPKAMYGMSIKKYQDGGATSKFGVKSYNFMDTKTGGRADSSSKQVEGVKYGEGNKRKYIDLDANKGTMTKTKFNKNNESSTKVKNIGTKRVANKISKITSQKIGGAVKRK